MGDRPLENSLSGYQDRETAAAVDAARLEARVAAALQALTSASKKALADRAVQSAVRILRGER